MRDTTGGVTNQYEVVHRGDVVSSTIATVDNNKTIVMASSPKSVIDLNSTVGSIASTAIVKNTTTTATTTNKHKEQKQQQQHVSSSNSNSLLDLKEINKILQNLAMKSLKCHEYYGEQLSHVRDKIIESKALVNVLHDELNDTQIEKEKQYKKLQQMKRKRQIDSERFIIQSLIIQIYKICLKHKNLRNRLTIEIGLSDTLSKTTTSSRKKQQQKAPLRDLVENATFPINKTIHEVSLARKTLEDIQQLLTNALSEKFDTCYEKRITGEAMKCEAIRKYVLFIKSIQP